MVEEELFPEEIDEEEEEINEKDNDEVSPTADVDLSSSEDDLRDLAKEFGLDEYDAVLKTEIKKMKDQSSISEDLETYASGFPDWDLLPPNK